MGYNSYYITFTLLCLSVIFNKITINSAQTLSTWLPDEEYKSLQWILSSYKIDINTTNSLCGTTFGNTYSFDCTALGSDGFYHLTRIFVNSYIQNTTVDSSVTDLNFPNLTTILVQGTPIIPKPYSILPMLKRYCTNLTSITIFKDQNVTQLPDEPYTSNFPRLLNFDCQECQIIHLPDAFMNNTGFITMDITLNPLGSFVLNPDIKSNITNLVLSTINETIMVINEINFPELKEFSINHYTYTSINLTINSLALKKVYIKRAPGYDQSIDLNFTIDTPNITILEVSGKIRMDLNVPNNTESWDKLQSLTIMGAMSDYVPFKNLTGVTKLLIEGWPNLKSIPDIPSCGGSFRNNTQLTGPIPLNFGILGCISNVDLYLNPLLATPLTESFCNFMTINLLSTPINGIPDCISCYYNTPPNNYRLQSYAYPINTSIVCTPSIDNVTYVSVDGSTITVTGNNLGYGVAGDISSNIKTVLTANKKFIINLPSNKTLTSTMVQFSVSLGVNFTVNYQIAKIPYLGFGATSQYPNGLKLSINGKLNPFFNHTGYIELANGSLVQCDQLNYNSTLITCIVSQIYFTQYSFYNALIKNDYSSQTLFSVFSQTYPIVTAVRSISLSGGNLSLYGEYGVYQDSPYVEVNNISCPVVSISQNLIICNMQTSLISGSVFLTVRVDGYYFYSSNMVQITNMTVEECIARTNNCTGHGYCDSSATCICNPGYLGDNCDSVSGGGVFVPNITQPTVSFEVNGYQFNFSMVSVQEVDYLLNIVQEVKTDIWNTTVDNSTNVVNIGYSLYLGPFSLLTVQTNISFSNESRSIPFAGQVVDYPPNSIKVSVQINNWAFLSTLNHLRVVFTTVINNQQYEKCGETIPSIITDLNKQNVQYLKIVKDGTQFFGRFLDYALSNGRPTYAPNQLMNMTKISQEESSILIGVHLPRCQSCVLDPDFSTLINVDDSKRVCSEEKNDDMKWKIIVGVVVGGVALIAIAIGSVMYYKFKVKSIKAEKLMQRKLSRLSEQK